MDAPGQHLLWQLFMQATGVVVQCADLPAHPANYGLHCHAAVMGERDRDVKRVTQDVQHTCRHVGRKEWLTSVGPRESVVDLDEECFPAFGSQVSVDLGPAALDFLGRQVRSL